MEGKSLDQNVCMQQFPMPLLNLKFRVIWVWEIWGSCRKELEIGWLSCSLDADLCEVVCWGMIIFSKHCVYERGGLCVQVGKRGMGKTCVFVKYDD